MGLYNEFLALCKENSSFYPSNSWMASWVNP